MSSPRIWVLLGPRTGDNNQALALAEALGLPFETRTLAYNPLQALSVWLPPTAATLDRESRRRLNAPWPDLVIAIGRRSVPVARWLKRKSGGRAKLVRIGHPRIDPGLFDLVITTRQYPVPPGDNVLLLPLAMVVAGVAVVSLACLAALGALGARAGGAPLGPSVMRVTFWGALAMAVTAGVGRLFGTVAG
jgi:mitochondrial fission protein ELM1